MIGSHVLYNINIIQGFNIERRFPLIKRITADFFKEVIYIYLLSESQ